VTTTAETRDRLAVALAAARQVLGQGGAAGRAQLLEVLEQLTDTAGRLLAELDAQPAPEAERADDSANADEVRREAT